MKKKKSLITYLFLAFAIMLLSVSTTLALVRDDEKKASGVITFEKVVLMGDVEGGSKLSVTPIEKPYTDGDVLFDYTQDNQELTFKAASDTVDFYVSVRATFETKKELTAEQQAILDEINASLAPVKGITPYKCDDYGYTYLNGWYHLATEENGEFLKVVSPNEEYIISRFYRLDLGADLDPIKKETFLTMFDEEGLELKIEVKATQAYGVSSIVTPETPNAAENNNAAAIISGNGVISKEEYYGFAKIAQLMQSIWDNLKSPAILINFEKNDDNATGTINSMFYQYGDIKSLPETGVDAQNVFVKDGFYNSGWTILGGDGSKISGECTYQQIYDFVKGKTIVTFVPTWEPVIIYFTSNIVPSFGGQTTVTNTYGTWKTTGNELFRNGSDSGYEKNQSATLILPEGYAICPRGVEASGDESKYYVYGYNYLTNNWERLGYKGFGNYTQGWSALHYSATYSTNNYYTQFRIDYGNDDKYRIDFYASALKIHNGYIKRIY